MFELVAFSGHFILYSIVVTTLPIIYSYRPFPGMKAILHNVRIPVQRLSVGGDAIATDR